MKKSIVIAAVAAMVLATGAAAKETNKIEGQYVKAGIELSTSSTTENFAFTEESSGIRFTEKSSTDSDHGDVVIGYEKIYSIDYEFGGEQLYVGALGSIKTDLHESLGVEVGMRLYDDVQGNGDQAAFVGAFVGMGAASDKTIEGTVNLYDIANDVDLGTIPGTGVVSANYKKVGMEAGYRWFGVDGDLSVEVAGRLSYTKYSTNLTQTDGNQNHNYDFDAIEPSINLTFGYKF